MVKKSTSTSDLMLSMTDGFRNEANRIDKIIGKMDGLIDEDFNTCFADRSVWEFENMIKSRYAYVRTDFLKTKCLAREVALALENNFSMQKDNDE